MKHLHNTILCSWAVDSFIVYWRVYKQSNSIKMELYRHFHNGLFENKQMKHINLIKLGYRIQFAQSLVHFYFVMLWIKTAMHIHCFVCVFYHGRDDWLEIRPKYFVESNARFYDAFKTFQQRRRFFFRIDFCECEFKKSSFCVNLPIIMVPILQMY